MLPYHIKGSTMFDDIIIKRKKIFWKCNICGWQGDKPLIHPGVCSGKIVDILDIMCPKCMKGDPILEGSRKEKDKWWDDWYKNYECVISMPILRKVDKTKLI